MSDSSPRQATADRRGQSSTIGVVLLIGIIIMSAGIIVTLGGQAISETQQSSTIGRVEHSMTLFDSRSAMVALGETSSQQMQFAGVGSGKYTVEPDAGWMRVRHYNYTGTGDNETIYNASLGAVRYQNERTTVAYQGGGVWLSQGQGSTMVSPPEFHFRQATLTLPVIQISGSDSATGRSTVVVQSTQKAHRIYPNATSATANGTGAPYDVDNRTYSNPVRNGSVVVTVHSEYYQGWAKYFETRTDGNVSVNHSAKIAKVELTAPTLIGQFQMPDESNSINADGMAEGHSVENFTIRLDEGNNFNNMYFSFWAEKGGKELEIMLHVPDGLGQQPCKNDGTIDEINHLTVEVYYHNEATPEGYHAWSNNTLDPNNGSIRLECVNGEEELYADFTSDTNLTYKQFETEETYWYHTWDGNRSDHADFNHTSVPEEPVRFTNPDTATIDLLVNHYFAKFQPDMELTVQYGPGGSVRVDTSGSTGNLEYKTVEGGRYITFLHITENGIRVEFQ